MASEIPRPEISINEAVRTLMEIYREYEGQTFGRENGLSERRRKALRLGWLALSAVDKLQDPKTQIR